MSLWQRVKGRFQQGEKSSAVVIARHNHKVSRKQISPNALKVLYRLNKSGYAAFLVGGSVRDLLLKRKPKDFDIATDAEPEEVRKIFRNSRMIGRRFRLVHVFFYDEVIEVSTFRANSQEDEEQEDNDTPGMIRSDNTYGTVEEDAWRRDFTVNALYYNIENFSVVDYTGGMLDLRKREINMIGDPSQRYHEDPVRLLRAMRLSAKLGFKISTNTREPLEKLANLLWHIPPARLFDEVLKLFFEGNANVTYKTLLLFGYMKVLFPQTYAAMESRQLESDEILIKLAMKATDLRFSQGQSLNPGFLMAILLWPAVQHGLVAEKKNHKRYFQVLHATVDIVLEEQVKTVTIPRRLTAMMRAVWLLQYHLVKRRGSRVYRTLGHRYFRAAYDFLELRVKSGEPYQEIFQWWKRFQAENAEGRAKMVDKLHEKKGRTK